MELQLAKVRQSFARPVLEHIEQHVHREISTRLTVLPRARIAIAVGSRGVANLQRIVRATAECIRALGGDPFVVPAMGSHGGATAEGQREILAGYGITRAGVGCPVHASMDVVELPGTGGSEYRVYMDRLAFESDGVVLINRIKPHTDFHARYESGLVKMVVVGLGNAAQAEQMHGHGVRGLTQLVPQAAAQLLASGKILLGLGIVENAYDETMLIEAIAPERIMDREPELLAVARAHMPRLPVDHLHVLIIDQMGKDISGVGMDTNIIGRMRIRGQPEPDHPEIGMIVVTDLTEASHGNATGMGLADLTTRRMLDKIDFAVTATNVATSGFMERAKVPMVAGTDAQAIAWALRGRGPVPAGQDRVIRIRDTLHLDEIYVSAALLAEIAHKTGVELVEPLRNCLEAEGRLRGF